MMNKTSINDLIDNRLSELKVDRSKMMGAVYAGGKKHRAFTRGRLVLAAVYLAVILSLTVVAAGLGYFDVFFDDKAEIVSSNIVEINKSVENNGLILTVESAYTVESGGYITATFKKKDGSDFGHEQHDGSPVFIYDFFAYRNMRIQNELLPFSYKAVISDDNKTLYLLIPVTNVSENPNITEKNVKVHIDYLQGPRKGAHYEGPWEVDVKMPKAALSKTFILNYKTNARITDLEDSLKTVTIESVSLSSTGCVFQSTGNLEAVSQVVWSIGYVLENGQRVERAERFMANRELDGKILSDILFTEPVKVDEIEYLILNGEEILLR